MFLNNPAYTLAKQVDKYRIYIPAQETEYFTIRHVEASRIAAYASAGATPEVVQAHLQAILDRCNQAQSFDNFKTDITSITQALMYRTKYPVDQHCGVRMGCILSFLEYDEEELVQVDDCSAPMPMKTGKVISEDPEACDFVWQQKKEKLAFEHQGLYDFFLSWGANNVPLWSEHLDTLKEKGCSLTQYMTDRVTALRSILPSDLLNLSTV